MDAQQQEYFAAMEALFNTKGWELLSNGWAAELELLPQTAFFNAKTFDEVVEFRIRYDLVNELKSLPELVALQKEQALKAATECNE
jgi:hypothetical protein